MSPEAKTSTCYLVSSGCFWFDNRKRQVMNVHALASDSLVVLVPAKLEGCSTTAIVGVLLISIGSSVDETDKGNIDFHTRIITRHILVEQGLPLATPFEYETKIIEFNFKLIIQAHLNMSKRWIFI